MKKQLFSALLLASLVTTTGVFVGCKDYDDDISKNTDAIASLGEQLSSQMQALQTALDQAKTDVQDARSQIGTLEAALKAAQSTADEAKAEAAAAAIQAAAAKEAAATAKAEAIAEAIQQCQNLVNGKANQADLDQLVTKIASIEESLNKIPENIATVDYVDAALQNLQSQINALNYLKELLPEGSTIGGGSGVDYSGDIKALQDKMDALTADLKAAQEKVAGMAKAEDLDALKTEMNNLAKKVNELNIPDVNVLTVLVNRILTSIALVPKMYIDGIEAIAFECLAYYPVQPGTSGYVKATGAKEIKKDAGQAEVVYRLNPSTVELSSIDTENIKFVSTTAKKVETRATAEPIAFNGIKSYENGLLTVKAKRNESVSLSLTGDNIWISSLMVPRKANTEKNVDYAEIYSENSTLTETTFTPQLAEAAYNNTGKEELRSKLCNDWSNDHDHFCDSVQVWESAVDKLGTAINAHSLDANKYEEVYKVLKFDEPFDLNKLVTICTSRVYGDTQHVWGTNDSYKRKESSHNHMTKAELKNYGIVVRFAVPTVDYLNDVDNKTNQQKFAAVTPEGILTSKTPAGLTDNRAVIGKEPIVRIDLVDTVQHKLVDQRYIKVKWTDEEIIINEDPLPTVTLPTFTQNWAIDLYKCDESITLGYNWEAFVNNVYAQIGSTGLSQAEFEKFYPASLRKVTLLDWEAYYGDKNQKDKSIDGDKVPVSPAKKTPAGPSIVPTTNEHGDALIGTWTLTHEDVERIIFSNTDPAQAKFNVKKLRAKVSFGSDKPTLYAPLEFTWEVRVTIGDKFPTLVGYYDQYWAQPVEGKFGEHEAIYVLPVQYNTEAQQKGAFLGGTGYDHCVYDFGLFNGYTYYIDNQIIRWIVKDVPLCGSYDVQFAKKGQISGYAPNYTKDSTPYTNYWSTDNQEPYEPSVAWSSSPAYKLNKGNAKALECYWVATERDGAPKDYTPKDYVEWIPTDYLSNNVRSMKLFANSNNESNWNLLNPLSNEDDISMGYEQKQPKRTNDKRVLMNVWARMNNYNYIKVSDFQLVMVAPLRIDEPDIEGRLEDGHVSGTSVTIKKGAFPMTDFRGYLVSKDEPSLQTLERYTEEQAKYWKELYDYYEVKDANVDISSVKYGLKKVGNNIVVDDSGRMTAADLSTYTNGNIKWSMEQSTDADGNIVLTFKTNEGSNIEKKCNAYIDCSVTYGFGKVTDNIAIPIYTHGDTQE